MSLVSHLTELRNRLLFCSIFYLFFFLISYFFVENIFSFLTQPFSETIANNDNKRLIYTGLAEVFFNYIKLSLIVGFVFSLPIFIYHVWMFIAPGLLKKEKKIIVPFLLLVPLMFILGFLVVYYFIIPLAWDFFINFETFFPDQNLKVQLEAKVNEYLSLILKLIFAFGLAFQLPVFIFLLTILGVTTYENLSKYRKYVIVLIFILAAVITPPDVISQIGLALPIIFLYELSVFISKFFRKNKK